MSEPKRAGWVYACVNPSQPDLVKIGLTEKIPEERIKKLSASTSVPRPFNILCAKRVSNCVQAEKELHKIFADRREAKEFFRVSQYEVLERFSEIEGQPWVPAPPPFVSKLGTFTEWLKKNTLDSLYLDGTISCSFRWSSCPREVLRIAYCKAKVLEEEQYKKLQTECN